MKQSKSPTKCEGRIFIIENFIIENLGIKYINFVIELKSIVHDVFCLEYFRASLLVENQSRCSLKSPDLSSCSTLINQQNTQAIQLKLKVVNSSRFYTYHPKNKLNYYFIGIRSSDADFPLRKRRRRSNGPKILQRGDDVSGPIVSILRGSSSSRN